MWESIRLGVEKKIKERLDLECMAWVALDELGSISQDDLFNDEMLRYELCADDEDTYYIKPGEARILRVGIGDYADGRFGAATTCEIRHTPSEGLRAILRLSAL